MPAEFEGLVKTSLFAIHEQLGARLVDFAGWAMPLEYEGTLAEHEAVRSDVGVFDVSHLGKLWITGDEAEQVVAATFTNDPTRLEDGRAQYTLLCADDGGVLDDLIVYRIASDHFLAVPNAANVRVVREALEAAAHERRAEIADDSTTLNILAIQGPRSLDVLDDLFPGVGRGVDYLGIARIHGGPSADGWLCRTGYTGEVGAELIVSELDAPGILRELVDVHDVTPAGLGARDTLRLEMGYPLHGQDITPRTGPYEARLGWAVRLQRDDFQGRDALVRLEEEGPSRLLRGLRAVDRGIPRAGMEVLHGDDVVGEVTSGTFSPTLRTGIGLAYLLIGTEPDDEVVVDVRGNRIPFRVTEPPFVEADPRGSD